MFLSSVGSKAFYQIYLNKFKILSQVSASEVLKYILPNSLKTWTLSSSPWSAKDTGYLHTAIPPRNLRYTTNWPCGTYHKTSFLNLAQTHAASPMGHYPETGCYDNVAVSLSVTQLCGKLPDCRRDRIDQIPDEQAPEVLVADKLAPRVGLYLMITHIWEHT